LEETKNASSDAIFNDLALAPVQSRKSQNKKRTEKKSSGEAKKQKATKKKAQAKSVEKPNYFLKSKSQVKTTSISS